MKQLIEEYSYTEKGYKPCLITERWQAALLNYAEAQGFENIDKIEKHTQTDEIFVLLEGTATLIAAEKEDNNIRFKVKSLETGIIYNIPPDVWHNIAMDKDARIVIFENANTHLNDCTYHPLNEQQQKELYDILKQL
jgi:mannose-6-phosphate isomerase-like protein (cupin superfamily)